MKNQPQGSFEAFYSRVHSVAEMRFIASGRFKFHNRISQWTIALLSVELILVTLLSSYGCLNAIRVQADTIQVVFAVLVLTISLLMSRDNYAVRADQMHRCGMELNDLARRIQPFCESLTTHPMYETFCREYTQILAQTENHDPLDYWEYKIQNMESGWLRIWQKTKNYVRHLLSFLPYIIMFGFAVYILIYVLDQAQFATT